MQNIHLPSRTLTLDGFPAACMPGRSTIDSGMAFLEGELEKRDAKLRAAVLVLLKLVLEDRRAPAAALLDDPVARAKQLLQHARPAHLERPASARGIRAKRVGIAKAQNVDHRASLPFIAMRTIPQSMRKCKPLYILRARGYNEVILKAGGFFP